VGTVDATDYAIYRELSPDRLIRFWASRRLVDPRISAGEIARRIGLSEAGVRARLRSLRTKGLLRGTEVSLHPAVFGASVVMADIAVRSPAEAEHLFRDLAVADGVVFARDLLDEEDRKVYVYYLSENPALTARRTALLTRLSPTGKVGGPRPYWLPPCERVPTPLDWKLLAVFRREPDATLARFAAKAGVSLKTAGRRFNALLDARACWWSMSDDSDEWPLAVLRISLRPGTDPASVAAEIARTNEVWLPVAPDGFGLDPDGPERPLVGLVPAERPAALEKAVRQILAIEGVASVRRTFGLGSKTYSHWVDERLPGVAPRAT
jgi:DNA-binding Lrp family transcriptional regulator